MKYNQGEIFIEEENGKKLFEHKIISVAPNMTEIGQCYFLETHACIDNKYYYRCVTEREIVD